MTFPVLGGQKGGQKGGQTILSDKQQRIISLIASNPRITKKELSEKIEINQSAISKHIDVLKKNGWLKRTGGARGYWLLSGQTGGQTKK